MYLTPPFAILAYFYTDIYGLPPAVMGTMFLLVRLLDAITDPIMGAIADATSTRWGRFRPWLLAICVPFAVSCVLVYSIPSFSDSGESGLCGCGIYIYDVDVHRH
ncbi:Xyloside transporter XynT [Klebsiella michiganensis]|uniref:Xyloside transporter XynT n=1 Tax=Klebsiella michiganensis TaxID=1134687 RepID=A0A7H4MWQ1_9ENTR|nr:Xyloside transporter XynT [Klebsiella michiganensis]